MSIPFAISEPYTVNGDSVVDVYDGKTTWVLSSEMPQDLPDFYNMELREDDVWLLGYPKCGNTWSSEMLYTVYLGIEKANQKFYLDRVNPIEFKVYGRTGVKKLPEEERKKVVIKDSFKQAVEAESPRVNRCHLPLSLLNPKLLDTCKVVFICRNLKDVAVSFFKMVEDTGLLGDDDFEPFIDFFMSEKGMFSPVCDQIKQAWEKRHHPNMYFLFYEDMKKDLPSVLHKMAAFLGKSLTDDQVKELQDYLSVESMRKNQNVDFNRILQAKGIMGSKSQFIRKGIAGDYKNHFTPAMIEKFDKWIERRFAGTDFKFRE